MNHKLPWSDWYYLATVLFHRTDRQFWRMTPRQLMALCQVHIRMNGDGDKNSQAPEMGTAQDLAALARMRRADG